MKLLLALVLVGLAAFGVAQSNYYEFAGTELNDTRAGVLLLLNLAAGLFVGFRALALFKRSGRKV